MWSVGIGTRVRGSGLVSRLVILGASWVVRLLFMSWYGWTWNTYSHHDEMSIANKQSLDMKQTVVGELDVG
jgi:hypothetical protein